MNKTCAQKHQNVTMSCRAGITLHSVPCHIQCVLQLCPVSLGFIILKVHWVRHDMDCTLCCLWGDRAASLLNWTGVALDWSILLYLGIKHLYSVAAFMLKKVVTVDYNNWRAHIDLVWVLQKRVTKQRARRDLLWALQQRVTNWRGAWWGFWQ